jgi:hypothetical protein
VPRRSPSRSGDRTEVQLAGDIHDQAVEVAPLVEEIQKLFLHGNELVELCNQDGRLRPTALSSKELAYRLVGTWHFVDDRHEPILFPKPEVLEYVVSQRLANLPEVDKIVTHPVMSLQGDVFSGNRHHRDQKLLVLSSLKVQDLPKKPTGEEVETALSLLLDLVEGFPFADDASRATALALPLTLLLRPFLGGQVPLFLVSAPVAGTGKSLLSSALTYVVTGEQAETMTLPHSETEFRKELASMLRERPSVLIFDNVDKRVQGASLASILTSSRFKQRRLGSNSVMHLEHECVFIANGNAIRVSDEIARRAVLIELDAGVERPAERTGFKHTDLLAHVRDNRSELLWAVALLVKNWVALGKPAPVKARPLGSFEVWRHVVAGILEAAGVTELLENSEVLFRDADPEAQELHAFIAAWYDDFGKNPVSVRELFPMVETYGLLSGLLGAGSIHSRRTKLGKLLDTIRGRVIGPHKIVAAARDRTHKVNRYTLVFVEPNARRTSSPRRRRNS